jgi:hypothetical protein
LSENNLQECAEKFEDLVSDYEELVEYANNEKDWACLQTRLTPILADKVKKALGKQDEKVTFDP